MLIKAAILPFAEERLIIEQVELLLLGRERYWSGSFRVVSVIRMKHNAMAVESIQWYSVMKEVGL